jgi:hypothetical protein
MFYLKLLRCSRKHGEMHGGIKKRDREEGKGNDQ